MSKIIKNKLGVEFTLSTLVGFILAIVVLVVIIFYFTSGYNSGSGDMVNIGTGAIEGAKNFSS